MTQAAALSLMDTVNQAQKTNRDIPPLLTIKTVRPKARLTRLFYWFIWHTYF
jgi:hypothetical protein